MYCFSVLCRKENLVDIANTHASSAVAMQHLSYKQYGRHFQEKKKKSGLLGANEMSAIHD